MGLVLQAPVLKLRRHGQSVLCVRVCGRRRALLLTLPLAQCQSRMRAPQMPINPPKPNFPDMGVTDWYKLALVETRYTVEGKLALVRPEEPAPTQPRFSEQPCPRWTAMRQHSLGGEDTRPVDMAASVLPGRTAYQQTMGGGAGASDDGDDETGELPAARKAAPSALTSAIEKRGKKPAAVPAPPPPRKK